MKKSKSEIESIIIDTVKNSKWSLTPLQVRELIARVHKLEGTEVRNAIARMHDRGSLKIDMNMFLSIA